MKILRVVVGIGIIGLFGFYGILFFFGDFGPGESLFTRLILASGYTYVLGIIVGALLFTSWKWSSLVAWGMGIFGIVGIMRGEFHDSLMGLLLVIFPLATALLGGYIGSILVYKIGMKKRFPKNIRIVVFLSALLVIVVGGILWFMNSSTTKQQTITSFDDCVRAGNPVMESFPEQCMTPDGRSFTRLIPGESVSLSGEIVCLPHKDQEGPQTLECAYGLHAVDGTYYSLSDTDPNYGNISNVPMNTYVTVNGKLKPLTDTKYVSVGIIEVESIAVGKE